jgi:hypothetical protein
MSVIFLQCLRAYYHSVNNRVIPDTLDELLPAAAIAQLSDKKAKDAKLVELQAELSHSKKDLLTKIEKAFNRHQELLKKMDAKKDDFLILRDSSHPIPRHEQWACDPANDVFFLSEVKWSAFYNAYLTQRLQKIEAAIDKTDEDMANNKDEEKTLAEKKAFFVNEKHRLEVEERKCIYWKQGVAQKAQTWVSGLFLGIFAAVAAVWLGGFSLLVGAVIVCVCILGGGFFGYRNYNPTTFPKGVLEELKKTVNTQETEVVSKSRMIDTWLYHGSNILAGLFNVAAGAFISIGLFYTVDFMFGIFALSVMTSPILFLVTTALVVTVAGAGVLKSLNRTPDPLDKEAPPPASAWEQLKKMAPGLGFLLGPFGLAFSVGLLSKVLLMRALPFLGMLGLGAFFAKIFAADKPVDAVAYGAPYGVSHEVPLGCSRAPSARFLEEQSSETAARFKNL